MKLRFLSIALLVATLLAGCNQKGYTPEADGSAVQFTTAISKTVTRASGTEWAANDAIGVFMKTAGQPLSGTNLADNVKYTTDGTSFSTTTPIYYPQSGNVDFVAYYPYRTTPATDPYMYKVDVSTQTTPAAIDLLWSANATNKSKSSAAVALTFDHKLSRVVLNITKGEGMTDAEMAAMGIQITGMPTKADFDLANGTLGTFSDVADIVPIVATPTAGYVATYTAILVPQAKDVWSGRKMIFTVGTDVYECPIPTADDFLSGKSYAYAITVEKTGVTVSRGTITDWTGTAATPENLGEGEQMSIPIPIALIPAGSFIMGSPGGEPWRGSAETQHSVTLTKDFYMGKHPVTNAQYAAFLKAKNIGSNGEGSGVEFVRDCSTWGSSPWGVKWDTDKWIPAPGYDNHPVIYVTWFGAVEYASWLSTETGLTCRLPTEAEWEYACRGDYPDKATKTATMPFGLGDGDKLDYKLANFRGTAPYKLPEGEYSDPTSTSPGRTSSVGSYAPNNYGLYDMHGNLREWCSDWHGNYESGAAIDPVGPDAGTHRVLRGGNWFIHGRECRSASRSSYIPAYVGDVVGFRVVFVP